MLHNGLKTTAFSTSKPVFNLLIQLFWTGLIESDIESKQSMLIAFSEF